MSEEKVLRSLELQIQDLDIQISQLNRLRNDLFIKFNNILNEE